MLRTLPVPFARPQGSPSPTFIGLIVAAQQLGTAGNNGFYGAPFPLPPEMKLNRPSKVKLLVNRILGSTNDGEFVRFVLAFTKVRNNVIADDNVVFDWVPPTNWPVLSPIILEIDNGAGRTFDSNEFNATDWLGLRIMRVGSADNFPNPVLVADTMMFEYEEQP